MFSPEDEENDDELPDPDPFRLRMRTRMREEEHAALAILSDWELLVTYALTSRRVSLPSTFHLHLYPGLPEMSCIISVS